MLALMAIFLGHFLCHYLHFLFCQIERFDSERDTWMGCGRANKNECEFLARGLLNGRSYRLRVSAVNRLGESEAAEAAEVVTVDAEANDEDN